MPYYKLEVGDKEEHIYTCDVCLKVTERPAAQSPKDWVVIWGSTGEATDQTAECYCPDHAQEGRERKAAR